MLTQKLHESKTVKFHQSQHPRHYPIEAMGVELGIWQGLYQNMDLPWLRWWDNRGNLLLTGWERSQLLAAKLRELGVNPDEL